MKVKAYFKHKMDECEFDLYDLPDGKHFVDFIESPAIKAILIDGKSSLPEVRCLDSYKSVRYFVFTSERSGEQFLFTEDFVELMQSMRQYKRGDENSFTNKMRKKIMERDAYEHINKIPYKGEEA